MNIDWAPPPLLSSPTSVILPFRGVRTIISLSEQNTKPNPDYEHFFRYTSGRWLWNEEQQLKDRYKVFNVAELQSLAVNAVGADSCISMTKLAEGGYNKVFRLTMNDGKKVLARIPNPNAGPEFYSTASEVATMEFARDFLQIPVPRVFDWGATSDNAVGSEYIIMEEASGSELGLVWDQLSPDKKLSIMREIVTIESKMLAVSFSHFGGIYFASDEVESAVPALLTSEASPELKSQVNKKFSIGPTVDRGFWKKERSSMQISRGPWRTPQEYALCVGWRELEWIKQFAVSKPPSEATLVSSAQNSPKAHLQLLEMYLQVAAALVDINPVLTRPTLWHDPEQQADIKRKIFKSTLYQLYLIETKERIPLLAKAFHLAHGKTRRLPMEFAGNTWDGDIVPFREALINVERYWQELGIEGECPYHFTYDELHCHSIDSEGWNEVQDFFQSIDSLVKRDGWTNPDTFDAALKFFSEL
ncbi:hypothetical protein N7541_006067 [Penicillium brevicompactum]|uniref:Aminoglycoside phosphotransferase domain-containing protein n=1 Tax=Penicillium brevicompactum TaxID=5074 RepID=A0A9W9R9T2_PENBR|nr:hypothetical protein N7541_006067 [Penicillium brevicompactum]